MAIKKDLYPSHDLQEIQIMQLKLSTGLNIHEKTRKVLVYKILALAFLYDPRLMHSLQVLGSFKPGLKKRSALSLRVSHITSTVHLNHLADVFFY